MSRFSLNLQRHTKGLYTSVADTSRFVLCTIIPCTKIKCSKVVSVPTRLQCHIVTWSRSHGNLRRCHRFVLYLVVGWTFIIAACDQTFLGYRIVVHPEGKQGLHLLPLAHVQYTDGYIQSLHTFTNCSWIVSSGCPGKMTTQNLYILTLVSGSENLIMLCIRFAGQPPHTVSFKTCFARTGRQNQFIIKHTLFVMTKFIILSHFILHFDRVCHNIK